MTPWQAQRLIALLAEMWWPPFWPIEVERNVYLRAHTLDTSDDIEDYTTWIADMLFECCEVEEIVTHVRRAITKMGCWRAARVQMEWARALRDDILGVG